MTAPLPDFNILRTKDLAQLLNVQQTAAKAYLRDIKEAFGVTAVMFIHFKRYFKVPE